MKFWKYLLLFLTIVSFLAWLGTLSKPSENLKLIACDVGQGDAILIVKGTTQILIDGGPGNKVLSCISKYIPFWDRTIEVVVLTHPDADHATGLVGVLRNYTVEHFVSNGQAKDTSVYAALINSVADNGAKKSTVKKDDRFVYGKLSFDILFPVQVPGTPQAQKDANNYSVVLKLSYGDFDALLLGDIEDAASDFIADNFDLTGIEYLKVPHHGSKNGLSESLLYEVRPEVAVISLGKNSFGHPHEEVLGMLKNTRVLRTDELGDIIIETDGHSWSIK